MAIAASIRSTPPLLLLSALIPGCVVAVRPNEELSASNSSCPNGMEFVDNVICSYGKLSFTKAGTINAQALFAEEVALAIKDPNLMAPLLAEVDGIWQEHKMTAKEMMTEYSKKVHHIRNALKLADFLSDDTLQRFLLDGIANTLHAAAAAMSHGSSVGAEILTALAASTHAIGGALGSPFVCGLQAMLFYVKHTKKKLDAWEKTAQIANALIQKSNCLSENFHVRDTDAIDNSGRAQVDFFKSDVVELCGLATLGELAKETLNANQQLQRMLRAIADVGKCLYPAEYKNVKVKCIEAIIPKLRMTHGEIGLLHVALSIANTFATTTDALLAKEHYGNYIKRLFGLQFPVAPDTVSEVKRLASENPPLKAVSCVAFVASQRAYAVSFERLAEAIPVWMQSFSRSLFKPGFSTTWHPCSDVFNPLGTEEGTCNAEHYSFPEERGGAPACSVAYSSHIWRES